jgi:hypothetical protein
MIITNYIDRLAGNLTVFAGLISGVTAAQAQWQPANNKWSMVQIINHLYDEEIYDFRARLKSLLADPQRKWEAIDPPKWVVEREYYKREIVESFHNFKQERLASIAWLNTIDNPRWENSYHHPQGNIKAGDLLISWLSHDLIHIRQINRLHWEYFNDLSQPYSSAYAGKW